MRRVHALVALVVLFVVGCTTRVEAPRPPHGRYQDPTEKGLYAGATQVDITPAAGLALHGHGPAGRVSEGTMLRLRCYPVVLRENAEAVAIVPCDLAWPSFVLQRKVAARLAELLPVGPDGEAPLGPERIALMATHTHGAPGHQFPAPNYSGAMSSLKPGYSEEVTNFLADAIAVGIARAWCEARPAVARWGAEPVHGLSKNRSLDAFAQNRLTPVESGDFSQPEERRLAERIVDPTVSVLRLDGRAGDPLAAIAFFGVHPTGLPNFNVFYHGDVFGFAIRSFHEGGGAKVPVLGIANGLSGDVSPAVDFQGTREAKRLGADLAKAIRAAYEKAGPPVQRPLRVAYQEVHMPGADVVPDPAFFGPFDADPATKWPAMRVGIDLSKLCLDPQLGLVASGGAEDGRTALAMLGDLYIEASPAALAVDASGCQAPKRPLHGLPWSPKDAFPMVAPLHAVVVGDGLLVTYPAEVSVTSGMRARRRLDHWLRARSNASEPSPRHVVQATLTSEYFQYIATEDEFYRQNYEGASTLYGPATGRFMANQQLCLARWLLDGQPCARGRGMAAIDATFPVAWDATVAALEPAPEACGAEPVVFDRGWWTRDGENGYRAEIRAKGCDGIRHTPRVRILADEPGKSADQRVLDSDEGSNVTLRFVAGDTPGGCTAEAECRGGCPYWELTWLPDPAALARWRASKAGVAVEVRFVAPPKPTFPPGRDVDDPYASRPPRRERGMACGVVGKVGAAR